MIPQTTTTTALALPAASTLPEHRVRSDAVQRASASSGVSTTTHQAAAHAARKKFSYSVLVRVRVIHQILTLPAMPDTAARAPARRGRFAPQTSSARFHALPMHWETVQPTRTLRTTVQG